VSEDELPIDPRIADRREEVHREHRRRWLVRLGIVVGLFLVAALGVAATRSPLLDVDTVEVVGADRTGSDTVLSAVDGLAGSAMLDVDPGAVAASVSALPWVSGVEVRREWPSTVVIELTERTGVAVVAVDDQTWQTIDADGRVLAEQPERPDGMVSLMDVAPGSAPGDRLEGVDELLEVASAVGADEASLITGVRADGDDVLLELAPGGVALLGDTTRLDDKIEATVTLLRSVDDRCMIRIDVRVPAMPTITRDDACAGATPPTTAPPTTLPFDAVGDPTTAATSSTDPLGTEPTATTAWVPPTTVDPVLGDTTATGAG
jgi:cell division protein FtsQ